MIINGTLTANGTAGTHISISSGTIQKNSSTICLNYATLTNVIATGSASFYAANSSDLGGNTGWTFASCGGGALIPIAYFTANTTSGLAPLTVNFSDASLNSPTSRSWQFPGGNPSTSTSSNPTVTYTVAGSYNVTLQATNSAGTGDTTILNYITVTPNNVNGISGASSYDFGNVISGGFADHVYFIYNNTNQIVHISNLQFPTGFTALIQNGDSILPYNQLPIALFFYPVAQQSYSGTVTITSDAPNSTFTFTVSGIGVQTSVSSIAAYNMPVNNPDISQLEMLTSNYIASSTPTPINICADGSKATIIRYSNKNASINTSGILMRMKSDPFGNNTDYTGWFITTDYSFQNDTVTAKFTHPKYLNISGLYREDTIQIVDGSTSNVIYEHPVKIYRAPVILIHGLWGNFLSMIDIQSALTGSGKYNNALIDLADYETTNASSFNTNANVIKNEINNTLISLRILKYSAGSVDIVGHSMGGVLARIYIQNTDCNSSLNYNCYRGDIHKLITLNTPHSGTQIANFLLSSAWGAGLAQTILDYNGMYWDHGAVDDLRCNSLPIANMNGPYLNNHVVPSHSVITDRLVQTNYLTFDEEALANIIANARAESASDFVNIVFNSTTNDLIVPSNSQTGGLAGYSSISGVEHTQSPSNSTVVQKVQLLLDADPSTSSYFTLNSSGYSPATITPTFKTDPYGSDPLDGLRSGTISITNPQIGYTTTPGATVQISIVASSNITKVITVIGNQSVGYASVDTNVTNFTINYTIPSNAVGDLKIMAIAFDSGFVALDTLNITAVPNITFDSIKFVNASINIPKTQEKGMTLLGYYSNGNSIDLTRLPSVAYSFSNLKASLTSQFNVLGVDTGLTVLLASYQGKNAYSYVSVYNSTDWVLPTGITVINPSKDLSKTFVVYPNPATNSCKLQFSEPLSNIKIYISDILGHVVYTSNAMKLNDKNQVEVKFAFPSGLYQITVDNGQFRQTQKLLIEN